MPARLVKLQSAPDLIAQAGSGAASSLIDRHSHAAAEDLAQRSMRVPKCSAGDTS